MNELERYQFHIFRSSDSKLNSFVVRELLLYYVAIPINKYSWFVDKNFKTFWNDIFIN